MAQPRNVNLDGNVVTRNEDYKKQCAHVVGENGRSRIQEEERD